MGVASYIFLFVLFLANLFSFLAVLKQLTLNAAIIQTFVLFAYLLITASVLWGLGNHRRWAMSAGATLFFVQIINLALVVRMLSVIQVITVALVSVIGFLYCTFHARRKPRQPMRVQIQVPEVEKYGERGQKSKKPARKKTKKSAKKTASKKSRKTSKKKKSKKASKKSTSKRSRKKSKK
ncbi:MAG: hypothetical protein ACOCWQ_01705 [Nanoarchaeota archaeon]